MPKRKRDLQLPIEGLRQQIAHLFPAQAPDRHALLAEAIGDDWSLANIQDVLNYRPWIDVTCEDLRSCGYSELRSYLTAAGLVAYLPAMLTCGLDEFSSSNSRLCEILFQCLLPVSVEYGDVLQFFGADLISAPVGPDAARILRRADYVWKNLSPEQRDCVAAFIEIVGSNARQLSPKEADLVNKLASYWRG